MCKAHSKKNRVCFVSLKAYPLFNPDISSVFGGAEVDLYMLATELANDERFEVSFIVGDYGQPPLEVRQGVTLIKSLDAKKTKILHGWKIWKALRRADADVYMQEACSLGTFLIALFCKIHRRRFVYRTASTQEADGTYRHDHPIAGRLFLWSLKNAAAVVVQNQQDADNFKQQGGIDARVISNGLIVSGYPSAEKSIILWVGRSAAIKGPRRFLTLARAFPNESFVMICQNATGDEHYGSLIQEAGAIGNLTFIERVPFHKIDHYFETAKIYVNTSDSEGFPNTFVQACKAGAAILSFAVNPDGFLDTYQCGCCCQGQEQKMAEYLSRMLENNRYQELGRNGAAYARQHHDIRRIIGHYKELFI